MDFGWTGRVLSGLLISSTAFSRVYFGVPRLVIFRLKKSQVHYPHDVLVGILFGIFIYLGSDFFEIFLHPNNISNDQVNRLIQVIIWGIGIFLVFFGFDEQHKKNQLGLFLALGGIACGICVGPFSQIVYDPLPNKRKKRFCIRLGLGMVPIIIGIGFGLWLRSLHLPVEWYLFCYGGFNSVWINLLCPKLFLFLNLAASTLDMKSHSN